MKKFLLSFSLIFIFTAYVLFDRQGGFSGVLFTNTDEDSIPAAPPAVPAVPTPKPSPKPAPIMQAAGGMYKDGSYAGSNEDAYYGNVRVEAVIQGGQIADVKFLDHPSDRSTSIRINNYAMPILKSEVISTQSANVDIVSGATDTSMAFKRSLAFALASAKNQ